MAGNRTFLNLAGRVPYLMPKEEYSSSFLDSVCVPCAAVLICSQVQVK